MTLPLLVCGRCTACCQGDSIFLHEDEGDNPDDYEKKVSIKHGKYRYMLDHKPDNSCIYVIDGGCSIYDKRPVICRSLDCRMMVKKIGFSKLKKLIRKGHINKGVVDAAMRRMK